MKKKLVVISSLLLVFAFSSVDLSISPMVKPLADFYNVPLNKILLLISWATLGIVLGVFIGPKLTRSFKVSKIILFCVMGLCISVLLFLINKNFKVALYLRFIFGLMSGIIASILWWITYYGIPKKFYHAMITVLMASRALAIAFGVPLGGYIYQKAGFYWQGPFWFFNCLTFLFGIILYFSVKREKEKKIPFKINEIFDEYIDAFKIPKSLTFYIGLTINRMCYLGFYTIIGIWFFKYYNLKSKDITFIFLYLGLGESIINFVIPYIIKTFGYKNTFTSSIIASGVIFAIFIGGHLPLTITIALITAFAVTDRIYCMALVIKIPDMFPNSNNKTTFGSLNTLTAWLGLTLISWFTGKFGETLGIRAIELVLLGTFILGSIILYYVQYITILKDKKIQEGIVCREN